MAARRGSFHPTTVSNAGTAEPLYMHALSHTVEGNTESIENPLHEAAKRGTQSYLITCTATAAVMLD